jgi:hypothetical protein
MVGVELLVEPLELGVLGLGGRVVAVEPPQQRQLDLVVVLAVYLPVVAGVAARL